LIAGGVFAPEAVEIDHDAPRIDPGDRSDPMATGRYLAMTSCTECHGADLAGDESPVGKTPNLAIVAAYAPEQFRALMREGEPRDGRDIGLMSEVARKRFAQFTDDELTALYTYLREGL
jgi:mono/diheme cytochrome c family protein